MCNLLENTASDRNDCQFASKLHHRKLPVFLHCSTDLHWSPQSQPCPTAPERSAPSNRHQRLQVLEAIALERADMDPGHREVALSKSFGWQHGTARLTFFEETPHGRQTLQTSKANMLHQVCMRFDKSSTNHLFFQPPSYKGPKANKITKINWEKKLELCLAT